MKTTNKPSEYSAPRRGKQFERNVVVCDADLESIIPEYLEGKHEDCAQLRELLHQGNFEEIRMVAHGMKGSGGCYGFSVITDIGNVMEIAAKAGKPSDILKQVVLLEEYLDYIEVRYE